MRNKKSIKDSLFPKSVFFIYLGTLLIMAGLHYGLLFGMDKANFNELIKLHIILAYWAMVAGGLTLYTRHKIKKSYEEPMHRLANAASKVARGDFSVRVPPINIHDNLDYLDVMIVDFNKMVEELGSIETLRSDFFSNVSHEIKTPIAVIQNSAERVDYLLNVSRNIS